MPKSTIIISDLHLTPEFDHKKFTYLQNLIKKADRVIINGDLWSYYYCDFSDFLKSDWKKLFPIMLAKNCVYIHGNHDRKEWCDQNVRLFSVETHDRYSFDQNGSVFNIEHGHLISNNSIQNEKYISFIKNHHLDKYNYALHELVINKLGEKFYTIPGKILNKKHKKFTKEFIPDGEFLVCGHSHSPEVSSKKRYINTGFINYGSSSFLQINSEISLVQENY